MKGQGVYIFQNSTLVLFCKIESVCALVSFNCFSNNTTFALLFWSPIEGQCQLTRFCFGERLCTLYIFPWKIFAYEHSYDMEFLVHSNLELHCCIYSSHSQSEGCAYSCIIIQWQIFPSTVRSPCISYQTDGDLLKAVNRMTVVSHDLTGYDIQAQHKHVPLSCIFASNL